MIYFKCQNLALCYTWCQIQHYVQHLPNLMPNLVLHWRTFFMSKCQILALAHKFDIALEMLYNNVIFSSLVFTLTGRHFYFLLCVIKFSTRALWVRLSQTQPMHHSLYIYHAELKGCVTRITQLFIVKKKKEYDRQP